MTTEIDAVATDLEGLGINLDDMLDDSDAPEEVDLRPKMDTVTIKGIDEGYGLSEEDEQYVRKLWEKIPVNVKVVVRCPAGHPSVLQAYPIEPSTLHGKNKHGGAWIPQSTLFWLVCPEIHTQISKLEKERWVGKCEADLWKDESMFKEAIKDHEWNTAEKLRLCEADHDVVKQAGWWDMFRERGIGGISHKVFKETRGIKCLHLHYAMHLVQGNAVGKWLDDHATIVQCPASDSK